MFSLKSLPRLYHLFIRSLAIITFLVHIAMSVPGYAQQSITSDGTLPTPTRVDITGTNYRISEGTISGSNQFHSFGRFNVLTDESATFTGPPEIANIISRVTGGELSSIDGLIESEIVGANLYLLNPAGIFFGPNAALDVQGAFHASTADYLRLGEGDIFYADPAQTSVLSVAPPEAFGFLGSNPAGITIDQSLIEVQPRATISVIGGDITMTGGSLQAPSGQVNMASVASGGEVIPNPLGQPPDLNVDSFSTLGELDLQGASVDVSGDSAGEVVIRGGRLMVESSYIYAKNLGDVDGTAVGIDIDARTDFRAKGSVLEAATTGAGQSGDIRVKSDNLILESGSQIRAYTEGQSDSYNSGSSGNIELTSHNFALDTSSQIRAYTLYSQGDTGDVAITSDSLALDNGSQIRAYTLYSQGDSGDVSITLSDSLTLDNGSRIGAYNYGSYGNSGNIGITSNGMTLSNSSKIDAYSRQAQGSSGHIELVASESLDIIDSNIESYTWYGSQGDSGDIVIDSDSLTLDNSGIYAYTYSYQYYTFGASGDIDITSNRFVANDSEIQAYTYYTPSDSGDVRISSGSTVIDDTYILTDTYGTTPWGSGSAGNIVIDSLGDLQVHNYSRIVAGTHGAGHGGNLLAETDSLTLKEGGQIGAEARSSGVAGDFTLNAKNIFMSSADNFAQPAALFANVGSGASGHGGNLTINTDTLEVRDAAQIITNSYGAGDAGILTLTANESVIMSGTNAFGAAAGVFARANASGNGGEVRIESPYLEISDGASISCSSFGDGAGGDLEVNAERVLLAGPKDVEVATGLFARGFNGDGGNILVDTVYLDVVNGAAISVSSKSSGAGGSIEVLADRITLAGVDPFGNRAGILSQSEPLATGAAGDVKITANSLEVKDGAQISVAALGPGDGGNMRINADSVTISGRKSDLSARLIANTESEAKGGIIDITTNRLKVVDGGIIQASSLSSGDGGAIDLNAAEEMLVSGVHSSGVASRITSTTKSSDPGGGKGGDITIQTDRLAINDGAVIVVNTFGTGDGGTIQVKARSVDLDGGTNPDFGVGLYAGTEGSGDAGDVKIVTSSLSVVDGGQISISTRGSGRGGSLEITADRILLSAANNLSPASATGLIARTEGSGQGGDVLLTASESLRVMDGAAIDSSSAALSSGHAGNIDLDASSIIVSGVDSTGLPAGVWAYTDGSGDAGRIRIQAEDLQLTNRGLISIETGRSGAGGDMEIAVDRLEVTNGSNIKATAYGSGNAGAIDINAAEEVLVSGVHSSGIASRIASQTLSSDPGGGRGGDITIQTDRLVVDDGAEIAVNTVGTGDGGTIEVKATSVVVDGGTNPERGVGLYASSEGSGDAGDIKIVTSSLDVVDGGQISTSTEGSGRGGSLEITADRVLLSATDMVSRIATGLSARTEGSGQGGDVVLTASESLRVMDGAAIDSSSQVDGSGQGGSIDLGASSIIVSGVNPGGIRAAVLASTWGSGDGGRIRIQAEDLQLTNRGLISTGTRGSGVGGSIEITVSNDLYSDNSSVTSAAEQAEGGDITLTSQNVQLVNGSEVSAKSSGLGNAGNIVITASDTLLMNNSSITTEAMRADGGNIKINNDYMVFLGESEITASVGGGPDTVGGNVFIDPQYVILRNSNITANAFEGRGGNIRIVAGTFLADLNSRVDASSEKGIDGTVDIRAPIKDVSQKVSPLPEDYMRVAELLRQACIARIKGGEYSSFVVGGRDGLPMEPGTLLPSPLGVE